MLQNKDYIFLVFFGVVSFGVTITNYFTYLIGFTLLLLCCEVEWKTKIVKFMKINIVNVVIVLVLAYIQKLAWKGDTPYFLTSFLGIGNQIFEESLYMDFSFNLEKIWIWFQQVLVRPFIAGDIYYGLINDSHPQILFSDSMLEVIICGGMGIVFVILTINAVYKNQKNITLWGLLTALCFNLVLHFVYGYAESFMYSPHFLFYIVIILGVGISYLSVFGQKIITFGFLVFLGFEFFNNMKSFFELIHIIIKHAGTESYSIALVVIKTFLVACGLLLMWGIAFKKVRVTEIVFSKSKEDILLDLIWMYLFLVLSTTTFIWIFNT